VAACVRVAIEKRVWVPVAICAAAATSVYAIHQIWYHNVLHIVARCLVGAFSFVVVFPVLSGRAGAVEIGLAAEHFMITIACLFGMSDMMIFAGLTHLLIAIRCSELPKEVPRRIWWAFAAVLLTDGLDTGLSDVGRLGSDEWAADVAGRMADLMQFPGFSGQVGLHMFGKGIIVLALLQIYVPALLHWLSTHFPRDLPTLSHLGRNVMIIYACVADRAAMQLMAGFILLPIGLFAKDLGPLAQYHTHGKQGEQVGYLFFAAILILDGVTAPQ